MKRLHQYLISFIALFACYPSASLMAQFQVEQATDGINLCADSTLQYTLSDILIYESDAADLGDSTGLTMVFKVGADFQLGADINTAVQLGQNSDFANISFNISEDSILLTFDVLDTVVIDTIRMSGLLISAVAPSPSEQILFEPSSSSSFDGLSSLTSLALLSAVDLPSKPTLVFLTDSNVCVGDSASLRISNTAADLRYEWFRDASSWSTTTDETIVTYQAGVYTVFAEDTIFGCFSEVSDGRTVSLKPTPQADAGFDKVVCQGDEVSIGGLPSASGGTGFYQYTWSPASAVNNPSSSNPLAALGSDTKLDLTVRDANGCSDTSSVEIDVLDTILITINDRFQTDFTTSGDSIELDSLFDFVSSGATFGILGNGVSLNTGTNSYFFYPNLAGVGSHHIRLNVTSSNGCASNVSVTFNVTADNFISSLNTAYCDFDATDQVNYNLTDLPSDLSFHSLRIYKDTLRSGSYFVDDNNGVSYTLDPASYFAELGSGTFEVIMFVEKTSCTSCSPFPYAFRLSRLAGNENEPSINLADRYCNNDDSLLLFSNLFSTLTFSGDGVTNNGSNFYFNPKIISVAGDSLDAVVTLTYEDNFACQRTLTDTTTIFANPLKPTLADLEYCQFEVIQPLVLPENTGSRYDWYSRPNPVSQFYLSSGNRYILPIDGTFAVSDSVFVQEVRNNCSSDFDTIRYEVTELPFVELNDGFDGFYCQNDGDISLNLYTDADLSSITERFFINNQQVPTLDTVTENFTPGIYDFIYQVTDEFGCPEADTVAITIYELPNVSISGLPDGICYGDSVIEVTGSPSAFLTEFSINDSIFYMTDFLSIRAADLAFELSQNAYSPKVEHILTYSVTDDNFCTNLTTDTFVINPLPIVSIASAPAYLCFNSASDTVFALPAPSAVTSAIFSTSSSGLTDIGEGRAIFNPFEAATGAGESATSDSSSHTVTYQYTNQDGCTDSISTVLTVLPLDEITITADTSYCFDDSPAIISATPSLGLQTVFSGNAITDLGFGLAEFSPRLAATNRAADSLGPQTKHKIYYTHTNFNGCNNVDSLELTVNPLPAVSIAGQEAAYCYDAAADTLEGFPNIIGSIPSGSSLGFFGDGFFNVANSDTTIDYSRVVFTPRDAYDLSGFQPTDTIVNNRISYTYEDSNGCRNTSYDTLIINPLPELSIAGLAASYCYNSPPDTIYGMPATNGLFSINTDGLINLGNGIAIFYPRQAASFLNGDDSLSNNYDEGVHIITYTFTDSLGCVNSIQIQTEVQRLPDVGVQGFNMTRSYCYGDLDFDIQGVPQSGAGFFTGNGVFDNGDGTANFDPTIAAILDGADSATHIDTESFVSYTYTDPIGCTNTKEYRIKIFRLPTVSISGLGQSYCYDSSNDTIRGNPLPGKNESAIFNTTKVIDLSNGYAVFRPQVAANIENQLDKNDPASTHIIEYLYTDDKGCTNVAFDTTITHPLPQPNFNGLASSYCFDALPDTITGSTEDGITFGIFTINTGGLATIQDGIVILYPDSASLAAGATSKTDRTTNHRLTYRYTDTNNCTDFVTQDFEINPLPEVSYNGFLDSSYCFDASVVILSGDTNSPNGSFSGNGIFNIAPGRAEFSPEQAALQAGVLNSTDTISTHTITYTFTNSDQCTNFEDQVIKVTPLPITQILDLDTGYCIDADTVVIKSQRYPNQDIDEDVIFTGNGIIDLEADSAYFIPALAAQQVGQEFNDFTTQHIVSVLFIDSLGCQNSYFDTVNIHPLPNPSVSVFQSAYCIDFESDTIASDSLVSPGITTGVFTISTGGLTDLGDGRSVFNPRQAAIAVGADSDTFGITLHTISYTFTDKNGCTASTSEQLTVNPLPTPEILNLLPVYCYDHPDVSIVGDPQSANGSFSGIGIVDNGNGTAIFSPDSVAIKQGAISPVDGFYFDTVRYEYTDTEGCVNQAEKVVLINPLPNIAIVGLDSAYCYDADAIAFQTLRLPDLTKSETAIFSGLGVIDNGDGKAQFVPRQAVDASGGNKNTPAELYFINLTFTDSNACSNSFVDTVVVNPLPIPLLSSSKREYCFDDAVDTLVGSPLPFQGLSSGVFSINTGGLLDLSNGRAVFSPTAAALSDTANVSFTRNHRITYTFTDQNSCSDFVSLDLVVNPLPLAEIQGLNIARRYCYDADDVTIRGVPTPVAQNLTGVFSGDGITDIGNNTAIFNPSDAARVRGRVLPTQDTSIHIVTFTYTNQNGCENTERVTIRVNPLPTVSFMGSVGRYCHDQDSVELTGIPLPRVGTVDSALYTGRGITDFNNGIANFSPNTAAFLVGMPSTAASATVHNITYTFFDSTGCVNSYTETIQVDPLPAVSISGINRISSDNAYCFDHENDTIFGSPLPGIGSEGVFNINTGGLTDFGNGIALFQPDTASVSAGVLSETDRLTNHRIRYTFTDTLGCVNSTDSNLVVYPLPSVSFSGLEEAYCFDDPIEQLTGTPRIFTGTFTGLGITNTTNGRATFDPAEASLAAGAADSVDISVLPTDIGITYTYTDNNTCINAITDSTKLNPLPKPGFVGLPDSVCLGEAFPVVDTTSNGVGIFSGGNISPAGFFNSSFAGVGRHTVTLEFRDFTTNCVNSYSEVIRVDTLPVANFTVSEICEGDSTRLLDITTINSGGLGQWFWDFDDAQNDVADTSSQQNPKFVFSESGIYDVFQRVTSMAGCADSIVKAIKIGAYPTANYSYIKECETDITEFTNLTDSAESGIREWAWDFDDLSAASNLRDPVHQFSRSDTFNVSLVAISDEGCEDTLVRRISILPLVPATNFPYQNSFEVGESGWFADGVNNTWEIGTPSGSTISNASDGNFAWVTSLDGSYNNNEQSFVQGPCFDLTDLEKPMVSFDLFVAIDDEQRDGVVLQYSIDNGLTWQVLGSIEDKFNWYNEQSIFGNPGEQTPGAIVGWSRNDTRWVTVRNYLDELKDETNVRFRLAFGSDGNSNDGEGVGFDNFIIKEREKIVLLEQFTNSGNPSSADAIANEQLRTDFLDVFHRPSDAVVDAVMLQYHLEVRGFDDVLFDGNNELLQKSSSRALFYGVEATPNFVLDGTYEKEIFQQNDEDNSSGLEVERSALEDPGFDLGVSFETNPTDRLNVIVNLTANQSISEEVSLHIALVEEFYDATDDQPANGETSFDWLLRQMYPDAAGTVYRRIWSQGDSEQLTANILLREAYNPDQLRVVVFVQGNETKEIYQTAYAVPAIVPTVTSLERPEAVLGQVQIYPNPANEMIYLRLPDLAAASLGWELTDISGRSLKYGLINQGQRDAAIQVGDLPTGLYLINLKDENGFSVTKKVQIQH